MKSIKKYVAKRIEHTGVPIFVPDILLGIQQSKVISLVTWKELLQQPLLVQKRCARF